MEKKYKFTVRLSEKERDILNVKSKSLNISQNKFLKNALYFDEKKIEELNKKTVLENFAKEKKQAKERKQRDREKK